MKAITGILLTALLISMLTLASNIQQAESPEPPATEWNKTYGGTDFERARSIVETTDSGYALAGYTRSFGVGLYDFWLVKVDSSGNMEWNKTYGGAATDYAHSMVQTSDGGYALAGYTDSFGAGGFDFWLVKTDPSGNMEWNKTYGGANWDEARSIQQTVDGGYVLAGRTDSFGAGSDDFWLVKVDSFGNMEWNKTCGGVNSDRAYSIVEAADGGYVIAGSTESFGAGYADFWLVKVDSSGNMQWNKTYGGANYDQAWSVVKTADGGYALAGRTESFGAGSADFWLVKVDSFGNHEWNKTYGGVTWDEAYSVVQTADDGYALTGYTDSFGAGGDDFWLVKVDSFGNMEWNKTCGGVNSDRAHSVVEAADGGYALAGSTESFGAGNADFWLVKVAGRSRDVAVISILPSTSEVNVGQTVDIAVVVKNKGTVAENFTVACKYQLQGDEYVIGNQTVTNLAPGTNSTLTFNWNTTGILLGDYTIKAVASVVPEETDTSDNTLTFFPVHVGGSAPVDKFGFLVPYIVLALIIILAIVATFVFVKYRKKQ